MHEQVGHAAHVVGQVAVRVTGDAVTVGFDDRERFSGLRGRLGPY